MVETGGLENRFPRKWDGGSNPSPSATHHTVHGSAMHILQHLDESDSCCRSEFSSQFVPVLLAFSRTFPIFDPGR